MAGIDKTYVKTWEQYKEVKDFCSQYKEQVIDDYGNKFYPGEFLVNYTEEEFNEISEGQKERYRKYYSNPENLERDKEWFKSIGESQWEPNVENAVEIMIWNTPTYFDVWLIRNCEIDFIVARLKQQYGDYQNIRERKSEFDNFNPKRSYKFKIYTESRIKIKDSKLWWWIQVEEAPPGIHLSYDEDNTGKWYDYLECRDARTNTFSFHGNLGKRKLARLMKKWNLPVGVVLRVEALYRGYSYQNYKIKVI